MRPAPSLIEERYKLACEHPSDINEHLPLLRELASQCERVTEFGLRFANGSTLAFLAGQPSKLISWDCWLGAVVSARVAEIYNDLVLSGAENRCIWEPRVGDTLEISPIEPTDLLFIDTKHTALQLWKELVRHADPVEDRVKKYLVFHDTTLFGMRSEDGTEPGLRLAIRKFQREHAFPLWELIEDRENNNGLVVLRNLRAGA